MLNEEESNSYRIDYRRVSELWTIARHLVELATSCGLERRQRIDALGTVDRFVLVFQNQRVTNLKLLRVVDLTSYRVSTSAPAIPTGARRNQHPKSLRNQQIEPTAFRLKWPPMITILTTLALAESKRPVCIQFILLRKEPGESERPPALSAGALPSRRL